MGRTYSHGPHRYPIRVVGQRHKATIVRQERIEVPSPATVILIGDDGTRYRLVKVGLAERIEDE